MKWWFLQYNYELYAISQYLDTYGTHFTERNAILIRNRYLKDGIQYEKYFKHKRKLKWVYLCTSQSDSTASLYLEVVANIIYLNLKNL